MLTFGSLFAGIGGFDLGLERAGMQCAWQVEIDPYAQRILAKHWPDVPRYSDIRDCGAHNLAPVDVLCGGFPCQPFSLAGKQLGINDHRWLWPATAAVIRTVRPRYVLLENVSALVRDSWAFGTVLGDLHTLGFDAEWATLRASDFGAPHNRERVYIVAYPQGEHGQTRDRMDAGGERGSPLTTRGLSGLAVHQRREQASAWLAREPRVDRLADGIPSQVERLHAAGNAVVPQVAEHIGKQIMEHARSAT